MPGLKELEYLREELSRLGDERAVTAARGETYEELPHPTSVAASASKLDVDGLLASLGPSQGEKPKKPVNTGDVSGFDALLASLPLETPEKPAAQAKSASPAKSSTQSTAMPAAPVKAATAPAKPAAPAKPVIPPPPPQEEPETLSEEPFSLPDFGALEEPAIPEADQGLVPDDLLAGFAQEIEETRKESGTPETLVSPSGEAELPDFDLSSFNLDSLIPETPPQAEVEAEVTPSEVPETMIPEVPESAIPEIPESVMPEVGEGLPSSDIPDFDLSGMFGESGAGEAPVSEAPEETLEPLAEAAVPDEVEDLEAMDFTPSFETPPSAPTDLSEISGLPEIPDSGFELPSEMPPAAGGVSPADESGLAELSELTEAPEFPEALEPLEDLSAESALEPVAGMEPIAGMEPVEGFEPPGGATPEDLFGDLSSMDFTPTAEPGAAPDAVEEAPDFGDFEIPDISGGAAGSGESAEGEPTFGENPFGESAASGEDLFADVRVPTPDFGGESIPEGIPGSAAPGAPSDDFSNFTIPEDLNVPEGAAESAATPAEADGFDSFSLDEDFIKSSIAGAADEEFHIPGFSDFTAPQQKGPAGNVSLDMGIPHKGGKKEVPKTLSESDFRKFLDNLAALPLNLRIAIEEFLSGDGGTETQKMELVHSVLGGAPVKKVARTMEDLLSRSIPIPKDFEKKSVAEYEKEKSSLKYVFMNRILPAATLFGIVAVLFACVIILGKAFIYEPLVAESLYKSGYDAIEDARYTQSLSLFDEAVRHVEKKRWYFRYARAYREKKQYITAEMMYVRLLDRYHNDKAGGLEYADMLRSDLRNFEKAEQVLKRRVLDNYVNDPDGLLSLGDNYLDWAEEDNSKYEPARKTYATLIELYGMKDPYIARMMRFFIRTDKLSEVLPLKEHFMNKRAKIGASDLIELSGYLLEKRYHPGPGDSQVLIDKIEDVRALLERAVKADEKSPEANYNIGRFFIYNFKDDLAAKALAETIKLFDEGPTMSPRRVLTRVDAYRLLGETQVAAKEYLKAQEIYGKGISIYEEQRANRGVMQDARVGTLYADYADVDYFITGDLDNALRNYGKACDELHDTPSVRYRIGYIQYRNQDFEGAMNSFIKVHTDISFDRNLLYGFGNTLFRRGDYYAAQGYYDALMEDLESERIRKNVIFPQMRIDHAAFVEEYMHAANNLGVTLNRIALRTGDSRKNARALSLLSDSVRAWDALTRNPETLVRAQGTNLAFLNIQNMTHPHSGFESEIYADIPRTLDKEKPLE